MELNTENLEKEMRLLTDNMVDPIPVMYKKMLEPLATHPLDQVQMLKMQKFLQFFNLWEFLNKS